MKPLLAKSVSARTSSNVGATVPGHVAQVLEAAETMLTTSAAAALERAGLVAPEARHAFCTLVRLGAWLHDWGKANDHFQKLVRAPGSTQPQLVRHEALSALLALGQPQVTAWLLQASALQGAANRWLLEGAALVAAGHHLKFDAERTGDRQGPVRLEGAGARVALHLSHPDFVATLELGRRFGLPAPPPLKDEEWACANPRYDADDRVRGPLFDRDRGLVSPEGRGAAWWRDLKDWQRRAFALAKAWVVAADVAGSALAREGVSVGSWVAAALGATPAPEELDAVVAERLGRRRLRPFQQAIAASSLPVTLVEAGCGTGKTAAAYAWAAARGRDGYDGKLFFCYPTTGTATEGFRGYVADPETIEARLVHGRSELDLEDLLVTKELSGEEVQIRNETLRDLAAPVVVCTVDTVLGLVQNQRRGLFLSPAISTGRFVFDEVHAYDDRMFAALLAFLRTFPKAPVLLMSASIPAGRRAAIEAVTGPLPAMPRPADVEAVPRYDMGPIVALQEAWREVDDCLRAGGKVLWVSNTVGRAMTIGRRAAARGLPVHAYHSRFRYADRVDRHRDVVHGFDPGAPAVLAVTTQVAEMSLDLSADLLITDIAPVPALVQRLGRLNRRATPEEPGTPRRAVALDSPHPLPYSSEELAQGRGFWQEAHGAARPLSQGDLDTLMKKALGAAPWPPPGELAAASEWLEGGFVSRPGQLRDAGPTATVVLEQDERLLRAAHANGHAALRKELLRCALPLPAKPHVWTRWRRSPLAPFHPLAPTAEVSYDHRWGAEIVSREHDEE